MFIMKTNASETFYLGDHVPDIYIYMDRINKKVYRQFRMIYKTNTNELVYCIEPGSSLSTGTYDEYSSYNTIFSLSKDQFEKIKLIAYYGYQYNNHTDIKWYAITQYLIWKEIMPNTWDMYFVDVNHNKLDNKFNDEINEIYNLVNNHDAAAGISSGYILNNVNEITISGTNELANYKSNIGKIDGNKLFINNLEYGKNSVDLYLINYKSPMFYFNSNGQNILKRGDVLKPDINFYVYVKGGKVKIRECNEETFENDFIGGTYEILNSDDAILGEVTCNENNCISDYLPVGFHKVRVKNLSDNYEVNEHIYDIEVKDAEESEVTICSIPKKVPPKKTEGFPKDEIVAMNDEIYETSTIETVNEEEIDIPYTSKNSAFKIFLPILILSSYYFAIIKNENDN